MALLGDLIRTGFRRPKPDPDLVRRIRTWVAAALALPDDAVVVVNEIVCTDPGCAGIETVMLVMRPGHKTRAYKVARPLAEATEEDVWAALVQDQTGG